MGDRAPSPALASSTSGDARPDPMLALVSFEGRVKLRRVHGSSLGRIPESAHAFTFAPSGDRARVALRSAAVEISFIDGTVTPLPRGGTSLDAIEEQLRTRVRRANPGPMPFWRSVAFGPERGGAPASHVVATFNGPGRRRRRRIYALEPLREVLRLGVDWPWCFSVCGRSVAYARPRSDVVTVVDLTRATRVEVSIPYRERRLRVQRLVLDRESNALVVGRWDRAASLWDLSCSDVRSGEQRWRKGVRGVPVHAGPSPEGPRRVLWTRDDGHFEAFDVVDASRVCGVPFRGGGQAWFSEDGRYVAAVNPDDGHSFARTDLRTGEHIEHTDAPGGAVLAVACSNNGRSFACFHSTGRVRVRSVATGETEHDLEIGNEYARTECAIAFEVGDASLLCLAEVGEFDRGLRCVRLSLASDMPEEHSEPFSGTAVGLVASPDGSSAWALSEDVKGDRRVISARLLSRDLQHTLMQRDASIPTTEYESRPIAVAFYVGGADRRTTAVLADTVELRISTVDASTGALRASRRLLPDSWGLPPETVCVYCSTDGARVYCNARDAADLGLRDDFVRRTVFRTSDVHKEPAGFDDLYLDVGEWALVRCLGREVVVEGTAQRVTARSLNDWRPLGSCRVNMSYAMIESAALAPDERTLFVGLSTGLVLECALAL